MDNTEDLSSCNEILRDQNKSLKERVERLEEAVGIIASFYQYPAPSAKRLFRLKELFKDGYDQTQL